MLEHMTSDEVSGWAALLMVHVEESDHRQHLLESGDGQVFVSGRDDDGDEEGDEDGAPE